MVSNHNITTILTFLCCAEKPLKETCLVVDVMKQWKKKNKNGFEMKLPIGYVTPPKVSGDELGSALWCL